ncbi:MAG: translation initiation factor IF-2 subunit gamma [Candidatus Aenigmarchaeota archaeon]|nr:translation initiation factor IF-2 subunit gamma [Candidatus Aenigmarchaeota archaeon]
MSKTKTSSSKELEAVNIGLFGHVDHGKTTIVEALTGKWADVHSEEMKRGITIRLGYADAVVYRCPKCKKPACYSTSKKCPVCFGDTEPQRIISFVDAPGHNALMATVLSGASLIDGALLIIAANEKCPQPQTAEHLMALQIVGIKHIVIVQNKIDMVSKEEVLENYRQIKEFVKGTIAENAPIIPISAIQRVNIDALLEAIEKYVPTPKRDLKADPKMYIARSFDVNKPGTPIDKIVGGVIGGSLVKGKFKVGDEIEIRPGTFIGGEFKPLKTKITSLHKFGKSVKEAGPGGLVGVGTKLDPALTKSDFLAGNVAGYEGKLPPVWKRLSLDVKLFERAIGDTEINPVSEISTNETLMITSGTGRTVGLVTSGRKNEIDIELKVPICAEIGDKVALFRQISGRWRLIGYGIIKKNTKN